ncbi:alpha/beta fold hydrolase [Bradyrhizobium sp. 14AA]
MHIKTRDDQTLVASLSGNAASPHRVALIHSLAMNRAFWAPVIEEIGNDAQVLTYDCRGHGESSQPPGPYTVGQFADDLAEVLNYVGWARAIVVGASMGGTVALAFATAYPHRTAALGLFDTTAWYGADASLRWQERAEKAISAGMQALVDFQKTRWFSDAFREQRPDVVNGCIAAFRRNDVDAYAATCHMLGNTDLRSALRSLSMPTRIAVGDEDYATPPSMAQDLHRAIPNSTLTVFKGSRHLTPLEIPEKVAQELRRLWASL